jgi:hypothetical protein
MMAREKMRVLVACEFSGAVRDAFAALGHDAWSCDILPSETPGNHYQGDLFDVILDGWNLVIAHPPCTALCVSGNRWYAGIDARRQAIEFVERIWSLPLPRLVIENPVGVLSTMSVLGKASQYIQPWQFGHGETKKTGLWLRGVPPLQPTQIVQGREGRVWRMPPSATRSLERARTYPGVAAAMAEQWSAALTTPPVLCFEQLALFQEAA